MSHTDNNNSMYFTFVDQFGEELAEIADEYGFTQDTEVDKGRTFERWVADKFLGFSKAECSEIFFGGPYDKGIDIGVAKDFRNTILLVQCKFSKKILSKDVETYDETVINELLDGINALESDREDLTDDFKDFRCDYKAAKNSGKPIRKIVCVAGKLNDDAILKAEKHSVEVYEYSDILDSVRIRETYLNNIPDTLEIKTKKDKMLCRIDSLNTLKNVLIPIHVHTIYEWVKKEGDALFIKNLRLRLPSVRVNTIGYSIKETLLGVLKDNIPENEFLFETLNNGLNIVCIKIADWNTICSQNENQEINVVLVKPQIVNGCQTCWAIHDAIEAYYKLKINEHSSITREDIINEIISKKIYVWAKIIPTSDETKKEEITKTTNTQNPINKKDIRAESDNIKHSKIMSDFDNYSPPIFYEHKRGLWDSFVRSNKNTSNLRKFLIPSSKTYRKIDIEEFAQLSLAFQGDVHTARAFKSMIFEFDSYYEKAFNLEIYSTEDSHGLSLPEAIIFAKGIKSAAEIIRQLYNKKYNLIKQRKIKPDEKNSSTYTSIDEFIKKRSRFCNYISFVRYWNFFLVGLIIGIVDYYYTNISINQQTRRDILQKIFDFSDQELVNYAFHSNKFLVQFNTDDNLMSDSILNAENPTSHTKLRELASWLINLTSVVADAIEYLEKDSLQFKSVKNLIEQKPDALSKIIDYIANKIIGDPVKRKFYFPCLQ